MLLTTGTFNFLKHKQFERNWIEMIQKYAQESWCGYVNINEVAVKTKSLSKDKVDCSTMLDINQS